MFLLYREQWIMSLIAIAHKYVMLLHVGYQFNFINLIMFLFCFPFQLLIFVSIFCLYYHRISFSVYWISSLMFRGFPRGSDSKESTYNEEDLGLIPRLGRFSGRGHGNPSSIFAWRIPMDRVVWQATVCRVAKSRTHLTH